MHPLRAPSGCPGTLTSHWEGLRVAVLAVVMGLCSAFTTRPWRAWFYLGATQQDHRLCRSRGNDAGDRRHASGAQWRMLQAMRGRTRPNSMEDSLISLNKTSPMTKRLRGGRHASVSRSEMRANSLNTLPDLCQMSQCNRPRLRWAYK